MIELEKTYNPKDSEKDIYSLWEKSGAFTPKIDSAKSPFTIMMPPPNVTGKLHIGHALFITLEDILTRYHRMQGEPTLWLPGTDHAGIATQAVVEKQVRKEGQSRHDLGREEFVRRVWEWKNEFGGEITHQLRAMGASCDWSRERFTLDKGMSEAVNEAFVDFYNKGLIYQGLRVVNWCPRCHTAIADDEVEYVSQTGKLYFFRYDKNFPITIATTRPETKLGDTAVAVNPSDKRYKDFVGKTFQIDLDGIKREIKVIADRVIDIKFGTGAVGVTPAHSLVDWQFAEDHGLDKVQVIDERGKMTAEAGKYEGSKSLEAREKLLEYLKTNDLLEKEQEIENNLSTCYRCSGAIEPIPSKQWFVKMKPLAEKAKKAVKDGKIKITPKRFEKVYFHWMDNIRDWCISRQLWWGHQIPVWYRGGEVFVGKTAPEGEGWKQEEDVLDTWFSSGLWPFSTLGWPDQTEDFKYFYPTTVLETGYDILFFWVARMIMMGLELTGEIPFKTVYLHGLVRDEQNRKISKSLGNGIDPLVVGEQFGTDAVRMSLAVGATAGNDVAVGESKIKGYRNFSNKIWNIARFILMNQGDDNDDLKNPKFSAQDKKDLAKLDSIIKDTTKYLDQMQFSRAGELLYDFVWHQFADIMIEEAKPRLQSDLVEDRTAARAKLVLILTNILKMLHPFVPYVTETVWQKIPKQFKDSENLISASWPTIK